MAEFKEIEIDIEKENIKPIYFLHGEEPYFIDELCALIERKTIPEDLKGFNQTIVYGRETRMDEVIGLAKGFPIIGDRQLVIVKEAQTMKEFSKSKEAGDEGEEKESGANAAAINLLIAYLEKPQPSTVLVFCHKYKKLNGRSVLAKNLAKKAVLYESALMRDYKIPEWIAHYLKEKKYRIHPQAAGMIGEFLGNDLAKIVNEINKMLINFPSGTEINVAMVQENIGISKEYNVFELTDAIGMRERPKAFRIAAHFAANPNANPIVLSLGAIYGFFVRILRYHFLKDKSKSAVAAALGINPFFVGRIEQSARNFSTAKLVDVFACLREIDARSKGVENAGTSQGELLRELLVRILS